MNKFKTSAIEILKQEKKPLHYKEITRLALETGILETEGATPNASMNAQIIMDIKNKKDASDFIKIAPSTYALNPNKKELKQKEKIEEEEKEEEEKIAVESGFIGKAGEHLVCSELLFRGFNASIMSVDVGVDISAIRHKTFFGIQVKTSRENSNNIYNFHIRKKSFDRFNQGNIFYVLVLKNNKKVNFIILPANEIEKRIEENAIFTVNNKTGYALSIRIRDKKIYLGNKNHEISYFLNKWDLIK